MVPIALFVLGLVGLLCMTCAFPVCAPILGKIRRSTGSPGGFDAPPARDESIAILIPVHNEAAALDQTLRSVNAAVRAARNVWRGSIRICVGVDGCSDHSKLIAGVHGAEVLEVSPRRGKWRMIKALARRCGGSSWLLFADAGAKWPETLITDLLPQLSRPEVMAVAPAYRNPGDGFIEELLWRFESAIKALESFAGGVVSVHGATVCYRSREFLAAAARLPGQWLNDDVVIPLTMRGLFPRKRIVYLSSVAVTEFPRARSGVEFRRRRRMAVGNIQWVRQLWLPLWFTNSGAAFIASRRVFRLLWAYWLLFMTGGAALLLSDAIDPAGVYAPVLVACTAVPALAALTLPGVRSLAQSAAASLLVPYYFVSARFDFSPTSEVANWR